MGFKLRWGMSWRRRSPPPPSAAAQAWQQAIAATPVLIAHPAPAANGLTTGPIGPSGANPNVGHPGQGAKGAEYQRFRSFAERYLIARAHFFRTDAAGLKEDTWQCVLDAKVAYLMIERTGNHIEPGDGVQF